METSDFSPGAVYLTDKRPAPVILGQPYNIRVTGRDLDISLQVVCVEDIEIIETLLVKLRASISAGEQREG